jgi:GTP:adenosylcobinamide-phosphate guanylyltransferase
MTNKIQFRAINRISLKIFEVCGMSSMIKDADEPEWRHCLSIKQIAIREISDVETYEKPNWVDVDNYDLVQNINTQEFLKQFQELNDKFYNSVPAADYIDAAIDAREIIEDYLESIKNLGEK